MKKLLILISAGLITSCAFSQAGGILTNLILSNTPPANLGDWGVRKDVLTYIVSTQGGTQFKVLVKAEIKTTDGTVIGSADLTRARQITLSSATTLLYAVDVIPLEIMNFTGKYKTSMQRTGKLPSDNYMLCLQLVRPVDYSPVSEIKCKNFYLAATQLPVLIKPYDEEVLDAGSAQTAITFRWTPVSPRTSQAITYHLQVFEVYNDQTPVMALRKNMAILDQNVLNMTQFIWQPRMNFGERPDTAGLSPLLKQRIEKGQLFVWIIQSLDNQGNPVSLTDGNGLSFSEPLAFYIKTK